MDADGVGEGEVGEFAAVEGVGVVVEFRVEGAGFGVDGDDGADVAVEEGLVVIVAQLDDFVAGAILAVDGAEGAGPGVERVEGRLELGVEIADAGDALVHRGEDLHVVDRVRPLEFSRDKLGDELDDFADAILGIGGGDEVEVGPDLGAGDVGEDGAEGGVAGVDGVGGGDDLALALLAVDDAQARDRQRWRCR